MKTAWLHLSCWLLFIAAFLFAVTHVFINPGGTFISLIHTILPIALLLVGMGLIFRGYSSAGFTQRVVRLAYAGLSAALLVLIVMGTYALFREPLVRGHLWGW